tara:strand:+ start:326 stop:1078 length:753 start_codon:yes stop_codon:yes gene_type:complete
VAQYPDPWRADDYVQGGTFPVAPSNNPEYLKRMRMAFTGEPFQKGLRNLIYTPEAMKGLSGYAVPQMQGGIKALSPALKAYPVITSLISGGAELLDPNDPFGRNLAEGTGVAGGGIAGSLGGGILGGMAAGALAGGATGPFAPFAVPAGIVLGGMFGSNIGKAAGAGIYDAVTGQSPADRTMKKNLELDNMVFQQRLDQQRLQQELAMEQQKAIMDAANERQMLASLAMSSLQGGNNQQRTLEALISSYL